MKVSIDKGALMVPLYRAQGVIDRKALTNVLACVHIEADGDSLTFTATDYDVTMTAEVTAEVKQPGRALINGKALFDVVRALPDGEVVELHADDNHRIRVTAARARYELYGMAPDEFPEVIEKGGEESALHFDKEQIQEMLRRTLFSVSTDESRPALNGVLLEIEPDEPGHARLRMVSTDGHRLSKVERVVTAERYDGNNHRCIVHRRGASELQRIFEGSDPGVRVAFVGRNVIFTSDKARLQVRQIEENFPEYQRVIPEEGDVQVLISKDRFVQAIRRVSSLASSSRHEPLRFQLQEGLLVLEMIHQDFGEAREELELPAYEGNPLSVGFNPRYLLDVCSVIDASDVTIEVSDQFSPCLVTSEEEPGAIFVVMPMRLQ